MRSVNKIMVIIILQTNLAVNTTSAQDTIVIKTLPSVTITAATMRVPEKVWKNFASYFTGAYNSRFFKLNKDYLAKFILYNEENRALFTKQGTLIYNISYGYEKNLPEDLLKQVKMSYYDYAITRAIKITQSERVIWIINLENQKNLLIIQIEDGELQEVQQLNKI